MQRFVRPPSGEGHVLVVPILIALVADCKVFLWYQFLASSLVTRRICARSSHVAALAMVCSESLASRRQRPSHAKVRSTTQRRGRTSNPLAASERLTICKVQRPILSNAALSFGPPYPPSAKRCRNQGNE